MLHMQEMQHVQQMEQDDTHVREPIDGIYRHLQVIETSKKEATQVVTSLSNMLHQQNMLHMQEM